MPDAKKPNRRVSVALSGKTREQFDAIKADAKACVPSWVTITDSHALAHAIALAAAALEDKGE